MPPKVRRSIKTNKIICNQCSLEIAEEEEFIECDKCIKKFHVVCTNLDKRRYEYLLKHESEEYVCHICDNNSGTLKAELNEIKTELKKLDQLSLLQDTMNFMSKQYDDILKGVAENKKKLELVQKENKFLKEEVKGLKSSIKYLNDQRVKNDCLVSGVNITTGTSALDTVLKLTSDAGVVLKPECIDDAYFIKKRNNKNAKQTDKQNEKHMVVVKFNSKKSKEKMMSVKPILKENEATKTVFVSDFLSRETLGLLNYAKSLKEVGYRAVYAAGGRVFVKRSELSKSRVITNEEDVDNLLLEASVSHPRNRRSQNAPEADENEVYLSS